MTGKWLSAAKALEAVAATTGDQLAAAQTIATRAHAELIEARAQRLVLPSKTIDDTSVPHEFWWAEGQEALKQNWVTGDFSTWIDHKYHVKAFGVHFSATDIASMTMQSGADEWVSAKRARILIEEMGGGSRFAVGNKVLEYLRIGHLVARADAMILIVKDRFGERDESEENLIIPDWFWEKCTASESSALDWQAGIFSGRGYVEDEVRRAKFIGVQIRRRELEIFRDDEGRPVPPVNDGNKGGRSRLPFWDDLWIEISRQLYAGDLKPKRQADIAKAMHDFASSNGHDVSDTPIRDRARQLWNAIDRDRGN